MSEIMAPSRVDMSVIIPAYNEATRLPETLRRFQEYLSAKPFSFEIVVCLDGPTDPTRKVLDDMACEVKHMKILDRKVNRGKGYTVREGMLQAVGRIRLFSDADNSTDIAHFDKMEPFFNRDYDVVICSRASKDVLGATQAVAQPWPKRILGDLGNLFVQLIAVRGIWDTQCGFKAFRDYAAEKIFSQSVIDGWGFDIEVLALARALNYKIGIVPAYWVNKPGSHVRLSSYLQVLLDTVKARRGLSTGKYRV
ncbi:MAG TPA: dolichyl-phosphate beta-glucosyltransferase [Candidatus Binatia bacterium]|jgi:glycosyltransferase involved in cell wall biosynthesis|nr:dolichyl-phosphate beta-glucosyltransferase [Candidatus Binatia bacterium]